MLGPKISRGRTRGRFHDFQVGDTEAKPRKSSEVFGPKTKLLITASKNQLIQQMRRLKCRLKRN